MAQPLKKAKSGAYRLDGRAGFTLVEVVFASGILAVVIMSAMGAFSWLHREQSDVKGKASLAQIEEIVRREIASTLADFFKGGCDDGFPSWTQVLTSGATLQVVNAANADSYKVAVTSDGGTIALNAALDRCKASHATFPLSYFGANNGAYFCLEFLPGSDVSGTADNFLVHMKPIIAEFYYTNRDVLTNQEIACANVATTPSIGTLYYALYWTVKSSQGPIRKRVIGTTTSGNS